MELYGRYLENESFIDWVYNPTTINDSFWRNYILKNPEEKEIIFALKELLITLKTGDITLSEEEKNEILNKLILTINDRNRHINPKLYLRTRKLYKYAAILLLIVTAGIVTYRSNINSSSGLPFSDVNISSLDSLKDTRLTFDEGKQVFIEERESLVDYSKIGNVILNSTDTINNVANTGDEVEVLNALITPYGKRSKVILSDGTLVHLNAGTEFVFPDKFLGSNRTVYLSGEAFFEVKKNTSKPFIVKTIEEQLSIEVLGTKFNVSAYPSDQEILTVLTEGKVNVLKRNLFKNDRITLSPGQLAIWGRSGEKNVEVKTVNTDNYTLWIQGLLYFESEPIINVIKKIERFYNIDLDFEGSTTNDELINTRISGKLDLKEDIKVTLDNLMLTAELSYKKINNKVYEIK